MKTVKLTLLNGDTVEINPKFVSSYGHEDVNGKGFETIPAHTLLAMSNGDHYRVDSPMKTVKSKLEGKPEIKLNRGLGSDAIEKNARQAKAVISMVIARGVDSQSWIDDIRDKLDNILKAVEVME